MRSRFFMTGMWDARRGKSSALSEFYLSGSRQTGREPGPLRQNRAGSPLEHGVRMPLAEGSRLGPYVMLRNASRQEMAEARKTWGVALRSPASSDALVDAVDEAVELRAKSAKVAWLNR